MNKRPNGVDVVAIVGNKCRATMTEEIETAWRGLRIADKIRQTALG